MLSLSQSLDAQLRAAMQRAFPEADAGLDPQLAPASKPEFGDFQANGALPLAKPLKQAPRQIATAIVEQLQADPAFTDLCLEPQIAGPGFINLTIRPERLAAEVSARLGDERLGVPAVSNAAPVVVDFSSPNIAKEMHVGHLRSTIIGDSLARVLEFRGHPVLRLNHVGDWGTQFGMLITHLKQVAPDALDTADAVDLGDLVAFYREAKKRFDDDEAFQTTSREEVVKLQGGDPVSLKAWGLLCDQSRREFQKIYDRLDIRLSERGESFYNPFLPAVIDGLKDAELLVTDDGAQCVFLEGVQGKDGKPLPVIVQKSDGGFNYATSDLTCVIDRVERLGADLLLYVVGAPQQQHLEMVFAVARMAGWLPEGIDAVHVAFGNVLGEDRKMLRSRSGDSVKLVDLLDEAVDRATALVEEKNPELDDSERQAVAAAVGIGAVKYADLSTDRVRDYVFDWDRMLSFDGNTAPYLQYAHARIRSIFRRAALDGDSVDPQTIEVVEPAERALVLRVLATPSVIADATESQAPHRLCTHLFDLAQTFTSFYEHCPVLKADERVRASRLALCDLTARTLANGLGLLGIDAPERM